MVTVVTVLRGTPWVRPNGKTSAFRVQHVYWLHRQLAQHWKGKTLCLSDKPLRVPSIQLRTDWPGWWAKMEMFAPWIEGDILYMDLDTVLVGDITPLAEVGKTTVLRDFYRGGDFIGSGLMYVTEADRALIWEAFNRNPKRYMADCVTRAKWGDQGFLQAYFGDKDKWQDVLPDHVVSFKASGREEPKPPCRVACFHGNPRPWQVVKSWVPRL